MGWVFYRNDLIIVLETSLENFWAKKISRKTIKFRKNSIFVKKSRFLRVCGIVRYRHLSRIVAWTISRRIRPLSNPPTPTIKRYDSLSDKDFAQNSIFLNFGFKMNWLTCLSHFLTGKYQYWSLLASNISENIVFFGNGRSADRQLTSPYTSKLACGQFIRPLWVSKWPWSSTELISGQDWSCRWRHDRIMTSQMNKLYFIVHV